MENFEFVSPTHFVFGRGAEEQVGEKLAAVGAKRVLVHFGGGSAVASGLIDRVGASLDAAGIEHLELGGVLSLIHICSLLPKLLHRHGILLLSYIRTAPISPHSEVAQNRRNV